jgi:hypothetical protein
MGAMYACSAHDAVRARRYFNKVSSQFQPAIMQKCALEHVSL